MKNPRPIVEKAPTRRAAESGAASVARILLRGFAAIHAVLALLFMLASLVLIAITVRSAWMLLSEGFGENLAFGVIQMIGITAIAVVALQIAQTILEEEVIRDSHISAPTRVRRFLSRFLVVLIIALALEGLVAAFKAIHEDVTQLAYASALLVAVGVLLASWGLFIRFNRYAEELEPEAMAAAKREDRKLK
jgi:hypothetical protein